MNESLKMCWPLMFLLNFSSIVRTQELQQSSIVAVIDKNLGPFDMTYYTNCAPKMTCDENALYRTINGSCNNLMNPLWGATLTPYVRLGPATYDDHDHTIRRQSNGKELPGPRELQLGIFLPRSNDFADHYNLNVMMMGQWIAHDITLMFPDITGPADCCAVQASNDIPPQCRAVIEIGANDPGYSSIGKTCMPFRRAFTSNSILNCTISPQISVNQASAFLDSSQVYGHTDAQAAVLRSFEGGKLKSESIDGQEFSAQEPRNATTLSTTKFCGGRNNVTHCLDGGDPRHNQHYGLILYQTMFMRFHNYLASSLQKINPSWSDEKLYQESRKINIAVEQIAIYRDYIPILLGKEYAEFTGLALCKEMKTAYNPNIMPQLSVELTAASFRVSHNQVPTKYQFLDKNDAIVNEAYLNEHMSDPDPVVEGSNFEYILRGMSKMPGRCPTSSHNYLISNYMFKHWVSPNNDQDLLSIDIQRGRDNAVISYVEARKRCGFPQVSSYEDLRGVLSDNDITLLQKFFEDVNDVDLLVGSLLETRIDDALVGETTRCILADGFSRLRNSDRFFCDVQGQPGSFSQEQFDVLWNLNLTMIFCAMSTIDRLPCDIFKAGFDNPMYDCCTPLNLDLEKWRET